MSDDAGTVLTNTHGKQPAKCLHVAQNHKPHTRRSSHQSTVNRALHQPEYGQLLLRNERCTAPTHTTAIVKPYWCLRKSGLRKRIWRTKRTYIKNFTLYVTKHFQEKNSGEGMLYIYIINGTSDPKIKTRNPFQTKGITRYSHHSKTLYLSDDIQGHHSNMTVKMIL